MIHLVVGYGEVGSAIHKIIGGKVYSPDGHNYDGECDVMHVCFPYSEDFIKYVEDYKKRFNPDLVIIHSSVPVGTSDKLDAVHSPIRGVHPHLEEGIRKMTKYFGGARAKEASKYFVDAGVTVKCYDDARLTEAGKLWSTTQYGVFIMLNKYIHKYCEENGLDFDVVYDEFNFTYNVGYMKLGMSHVVRPILKYMEGGIGGHCVIPNLELLDKTLENDIIKLVNKGNAPNGI